MEVFRVGEFEMGVDFGRMDESGIDGIFLELRGCPDCAAHGEDLDRLEAEVRARWAETR